MHSETVLVEAQKVTKEFETSAGVLYQLFRGNPPTNLAVDRVSLHIRKGETFALVGESGCGKTTFGRMICMLEKPTSGTIFLDGEEVDQISDQQARQLRSKVQMIFQNPYDSLDPRQTVFSLVEQPLIIQKTIKAQKRHNRVVEILNNVGLRPAETFLDRYPHELSGGQRQRVAIARAMILNPDIIIADEPVSMLDVSVRSGILNMMMEIKGELGSSYLFITHDLSVARYVSNRIAVMYLGNLMEMGNTDQIVNNPIHPYTRLLIAAVPRLPWSPEHEIEHKRKRVQLLGEVLEQSANELEGCKFAPRCPLAQEICFNERPPLEQFNDKQSVACFFSQKSAGMAKEEMLEEAAKKFREQR